MHPFREIDNTNKDIQMRGQCALAIMFGLLAFLKVKIDKCFLISWSAFS